MVTEMNTVVTFSYSLNDGRGNLLESNVGFAPIVYLHGGGNILAELERGLEGLVAGAMKEIVVGTKSKGLRFNVKVISVRKATPAEIHAGLPLQEACGCQPGCC